ncbi:MAG: MBL fold metallo-hydrolase, partial [Candidatus Poseidoniaceae archaeon]
MVRAEDLVVETFFVGPLQMRCSVVCDTSTGDTVVIDAGDEPDRLIAWNDHGQGAGPNWSSAPGPVRAGDRTVVALLNTHAHFDHSGHIPTVRAHWGVEWWLHPDDTFLQSLAQQSAARWGLPPLPEPAVADHDLAHGQTVHVGSLSFEVLHTPGHTLGGVCLLLRVEGSA